MVLSFLCALTAQNKSEGDSPGGNYKICKALSHINYIIRHIVGFATGIIKKKCWLKQLVNLCDEVFDVAD